MGSLEAAEAGVFCYGSLLDPVEMTKILGLDRPPADGVDFVRASLTGWRQTWDVCTDNDGPQLTHYLDPATGERPSIQVLFLNIERAEAFRTVGAIVPASARMLEQLDRREANYVRTDVTMDVAPSVATPLPRTVFAYVGKLDKVSRARRAITEGTARIWDVYLDRVNRGLSAFGLGPDLSAVGAVPVVPLTRVSGQPTVA